MEVSSWKILIVIATWAAFSTVCAAEEMMKTNMQSPMICYPNGEKQTSISSKLLNQANRLLLGAMTRVKENKPIPNLTISKISEVIQKIIGPVKMKQPDATAIEKMPMKPDSPKPSLSQEIIDIAKGLLGDKSSLSLPGLSITRTKEGEGQVPEMMPDAVTTQEPPTSADPPTTPEMDTPPVPGPIPGLPAINGIDLNSLDLSSLGIAIPPGLDLNSLDLQNFNPQALGLGNLDLNSILPQIQPPKRDSMPQPRAAEIEPSDENVLDKLIRVVIGRNISLDDNMDALMAVLKAMEFVLNTDENTLRTIFGKLKNVAMGPLKEAINLFNKGSMHKNGVMNMMCYPADEQRIKTFITSSKMNKNLDMCGSCKKEVMDLEAKMKTMVASEVAKIFQGMVQGMGTIDPKLAAAFTGVVNTMGTGVTAGERKLSLLDEGWNEWDEWSECSALCGGGTTKRSRTCQKETGENDCIQVQTRSCNEMACDSSKVKKFMPWSEWEPCSASCGGGVSIRSRVCSEEHDASVDNDDGCEEAESRRCNIKPCGVEVFEKLVEEKFLTETEWTEWSKCSASCNGGLSTRTRTCLLLDTDCQPVESMVCNSQPCVRPVTVVEEWLKWGDWSQCSVTCGTGTSIRRRYCVKKSATSKCEQVQSKICNGGFCPTATPQIWSTWSECSVTCGSGRSIRRRGCPQPNAKPECRQIQSRICRKQMCSSWRLSQWSEWNKCSVSCGGGQRSRSRSCRYGTCLGDLVQTESCNYLQCPESKVTQSCPPSSYKTLQIAGSCIVLHGAEVGPLSFTAYRNYCQSKGGDLIRMPDVATWVQVTWWLQNIVQTNYNVARINDYQMPFIGATDTDHWDVWTYPGETTPLNFLLWGRGEPRKTSNTDRCVKLNPQNGHAAPVPCTSPHFAICQYQTQ